MSYRTIVADPPWDMSAHKASTMNGYETFRSALPYPTLSLDEICALPVETLATPQAHLYLWTTATMLFKSPEVVRSWGFQPKQVLVWAKPLGFGRRFRQSCEYILFATRGGPLPVTRHDVGTWFRWPRGEHSVKPDAFLDLVETVSPGPYLEMFARRQRLGWDTWGNESLQHVEME